MDTPPVTFTPIDPAPAAAAPAQDQVVESAPTTAAPAAAADPVVVPAAPAAPTKPNALILLGSYKGKGGFGLDQAIKADFGPVFGGARLWCRNQGSFSFVSPDPADTMLFAKSHDLAGQERYNWVDQGNGVSYGYLKPEAR